MRFARSGTNWEGRPWILTPALSALCDQIEAAWAEPHPADGTVASKPHDQSNPTSDHRPFPFTGSGVVYALDVGEVTEDDGFLLAEQLRLSQDSRLKYVIHEARLFSSYAGPSRPPWTWGPYTGASGHLDHVHVSVNRSAGPGAWAITLEDEMVTRDTKADDGLPALAGAVERAIAAGIATIHTQPGGVAFNDELLTILERALAPVLARLTALEGSDPSVPHSHAFQGSTLPNG